MSLDRLLSLGVLSCKVMGQSSVQSPCENSPGRCIHTGPGNGQHPQSGAGFFFFFFFLPASSMNSDHKVIPSACLPRKLASSAPPASLEGDAMISGF